MANKSKTELPEHSQVIPRLRLLMNTLSLSERTVLAFCLEVGNKLYEYDIASVAKRCDVSTSLVVKVAKRCGFTGFKEMRSALAGSGVATGNDLHQDLSPADDPATILNKVFSTSIVALQDTMRILEPALLKEVADRLHAADQITFVGVGGSGALAIDAYHKFLRIGVHSQYLTDTHLMVMSASVMTPRSVLVGFSHSGRTSAVVEAFKAAKKQGATTIAIVNSLDSLLARASDRVLCSVAQGSPINGENAAARIAMLNILDVLFVLYAQHDYEKSLGNLRKTIDSVANLRA